MSTSAPDAERLQILVLGGSGDDRWTAAGHRVTELDGRGRRWRRLRAAWATLRGGADGADVVVEVLRRRPLLTPLWPWLEPATVVCARNVRLPGDGARERLRAALFGRLLAPVLYRDVAFVADTAETRDALVGLGVHPETVTVGDGAAALAHAAGTDRPAVRETIARSETAKAAGLAAATLAANAIQLVFTVVFTRLLGVADYGSLAVLISAFLVLLVMGSAVQVAAARDTALGTLGQGPQLAATLAAWGRRMAAAVLVAVAAGVLLRRPLADLVGVPEHPWAAAGILPIGVLWLILCLERGVLQGLHAYGAVARSLIGEAGGRLVFSLLLIAAGAGVTGAYLGLGLAFAAVAGWLVLDLLRRLGAPAGHAPYALGTLFRVNWRPMVALAFLGALQNIDVILAKQQLGGHRGGAYAAAAVAARTAVWVAIGIGLHLLPEATRRAASGLDPRPVLVRSLQIVGLIAVPALLVFAAVPKLVLRIGFGSEYTRAWQALIVLAAAMAVLAVSYLTVQYLIALGRRGFLWILGPIAVAEPLLLIGAPESLLGFSLVVLAVQAAAGAGLLAIGLGGRRRREVAL